MKNKYLLLFCALLICFLFSCKKNNTAQQPVSILGKWNLKSQHAVFYIDGLLKVDTIFYASQVDFGFLQFNQNGTFSSTTVYVNTLQNHDPGSSGNSQGTYVVSGNGFSISPGIAGWFNYVASTSPAPTLVSNFSEVKSLTSSTLDVHIESAFSYITNAKTTTIRCINDFSYTK